jgi:hypothetical protein
VAPIRPRQCGTALATMWDMTRSLHLLVLGLALPAPLLAGCEAVSDSHRALPQSAVDPVPEVPPDDQPDAGRPDDASAPPESDASPPTAPASSYEQMCRHYCRTLEETLLYYCLGTGADRATCMERFPDHAARCYQDRCAPQLVPVSLCPRQCDSLAPHYEAVCATRAIGQDPLCPSSPAEHDRACRAGCG